MYKGNTIVGKPMVTYDLGEQIGKVADLVIDFSNNQILGLSLSEGQWSQRARMLPLHEVHALGLDVIIVSSRSAIVEVDQTAETKLVLGHDMVRKRIKLLTTAGRDLGAMTDVYFDERSGVIQGYEVEGGFFAAASCGRSFVPAPHTLKIGADVAFVPPETVDLMTEQEVEATVTSDTPQVASGPQAGAREFAEAESHDIPVYRSIEETKGRRVRRSVQTPTGFVVAAQGQIVSDAVIEQTCAHHQKNRQCSRR
jgi:uncharacterized protein YrrD